jgi:hypothetical protein
MMELWTMSIDVWMYEHKCASVCVCGMDMSGDDVGIHVVECVDGHRDRRSRNQGGMMDDTDGISDRDGNDGSTSNDAGVI